MADKSPSGQKFLSPNILTGAKNNILEFSCVNLSDDEEDDGTSQNSAAANVIEDFDTFKKQFNLKQILDKLVVKREFFIPSKAMDINEFYIFEKVRVRQLIKNKKLFLLFFFTYPDV